MSRVQRKIARRRGGFTLLEVLLAVSISLLLMAALYLSVKMYVTAAQRGPERVQRAHAARAILRRMARDVRAVLPAPPHAGHSASLSDEPSSGTVPSGPTGSAPAPSSLNPASSSASSSSSSSASTDSSRDAVLEQAAYGLRGGSDWIELYIAEQRPDLDDRELLASGGSAAHASNVLRVSYSWSRVPMSTEAQPRWGIARTTVVAALAGYADSSPSDISFRAATDFLFDDATALQFQYWDDLTGTWIDSWGSDLPVAPPRAVKIFVRLEPTYATEAAASAWDASYSLVVPVPAWTPDDSSFSSVSMAEL